MINVKFIIAVISAIILLPFVIYLVIKVLKAKTPVLFSDDEKITYLFKSSEQTSSTETIKIDNSYKIAIVLFIILILSIIVLIYKIPKN